MKMFYTLSEIKYYDGIHKQITKVIEPVKEHSNAKFFKLLFPLL